MGINANIQKSLYLKAFLIVYILYFISPFLTTDRTGLKTHGCRKERIYADFRILILLKRRPKKSRISCFLFSLNKTTSFSSTILLP